MEVGVVFYYGDHFQEYIRKSAITITKKLFFIQFLVGEGQIEWSDEKNNNAQQIIPIFFLKI